MVSSSTQDNELNRMADADRRTYRADDIISFRKTAEAFGGLSNMAPGYPVHVAGVAVRTAEALYQACRFPHLPDVQRMIVDETSPMTAKMRSKPCRTRSRAYWDDIRVPIMKWCLRVKLAQNWDKFGDLLVRTGDRPIVEESGKDDFWGAIKDERGDLHGRNVLGRLLMELRGKLDADPDSLKAVPPVGIPDFTLVGRNIAAIAVGMPTLVSADRTPRRNAAQEMLSPTP